MNYEGNGKTSQIDGMGASDRGADSKTRVCGELDQAMYNLYMGLSAGNEDILQRIYDSLFMKEPGDEFEHPMWPHPDVLNNHLIERHCNIPLTKYLYDRLYYERVYLYFPSELTWKIRGDSWLSTMDILLDFALFFKNPDQKFQFPSSWLWDIFSNFIFQYREACMARSNILRSLPSDERRRTATFYELIEHGESWNTPKMYYMLHFIINQGKLRQNADVNVEGSNSNILETNFSAQATYFATIALIQVYTQSGDFYSSLKLVEDLDMSPKAFSWRVPACHVSLCYYVSSCYLFLGRFLDAQRVASELLIQITKQKQAFIKNQHPKQNCAEYIEKLYLISLFCNCVTGTPLDDTINDVLVESYSEKYFRAQEDTDEIYTDLFNSFSPYFSNGETYKYLSDASLRFAVEDVDEPKQRHLDTLLYHIGMQKKRNNLLAATRLYNCLNVEKMTNLMDYTEGETKQHTGASEIMVVKSALPQYVWREGSLLKGEKHYNSRETGLQYYVSGDSVICQELRQRPVYIDALLSQLSDSRQLLETCKKYTPQPIDVNIEGMLNAAQESIASLTTA